MDLDELYRLLRGSHLQAVGIVSTLRDPILVLDHDLCVLSASPGYYRDFQTTRDETIGVAFKALGNGQWDIPDLHLLLEQVIPKSASVFDYEVRTEFPNLGARVMLVSAQRLQHPDSGQRILMLSIIDATERSQADERKDILIGELDHRLKNVQAAVFALASHTKTVGRSAEEYRTDLLGRLEAYSRALAASREGGSSTLAELMKVILEPYRGGVSEVSLSTEVEIMLSPSHLMPLGMILHELATNALKYGALSAPNGHLAVSGRQIAKPDGSSEIILQWAESGGPEVTPPAKTGFGTRLILFSAEHDLNGRATLTYNPQGFVAKLEFPYP